MAIDPTLPGKPLITIASKGNPWYREAKVSSTIPVALLMTMAPNKGGQPCHMRSFTQLLRRAMKKQEVADRTRHNIRIGGNGVLIKSIRSEETVASRQSVTKSRDRRPLEVQCCLDQVQSVDMLL